MKDGCHHLHQLPGEGTNAASRLMLAYLQGLCPKLLIWLGIGCYRGEVINADAPASYHFPLIDMRTWNAESVWKWAERVPKNI